MAILSAKNGISQSVQDVSYLPSILGGLLLQDLKNKYLVHLSNSEDVQFIEYSDLCKGNF